MIKFFLIFSLLSFIAYATEKDPDPFVVENLYPTPRLFIPKVGEFLLLDKKVKAIVEGPYAEIQSIYTYKNTLDHLVAAQFEFPQTETDIFQKVEIRHQDSVRVIFDEVNSPKKQYDRQDPSTNERFLYKEIQAGNIQANETVEVIFTVMRSLKVILNQFYELSIRPYHDSRFKTFSSLIIPANYDIQIELRSERKFAILANPSHQLRPELSNHTDPILDVMSYKAFYNATMSDVVWFTDEFKIYFASVDLNAPQTIMATHSFNPHDHTFMFSLVPDMNYFLAEKRGWQWEKIRPILKRLHDPNSLLKLKKEAVQSELSYFENEYLFVIDRSDSMRGSSIENLKKALNKLLDSFSESCPLFSILSFGSTLELHGNRSKESPYKLPEKTKEIMQWVETIEANMGEKDLLGALKYTFEQYQWYYPPRNVIILTDGEVSNADEIIQLLQANSHSHKVCAMTLHAGNDEFIGKIGQAGGCSTQPTRREEEALSLLESTVHPSSFNLAYEITCFNDSDIVVHREEGKSEGLAVDQVFTKWVRLNNIPNLKSCEAKIFYYSKERCSSSYERVEIFRSQTTQITDVWHKVADYANFQNESQIEGSDRKLLTNDTQHQQSRYDEYQEQFRNLGCYDRKNILTGIVPSKPFFKSAAEEEDDDEQEIISWKHEEEEWKNFSTKHKEDEEEAGFSSIKIICAVSVFTLLFVAALFITG